MSESDLQTEILRYLGALPSIGHAWRNNRGRRGYIRFGGPEGASDIFGYTRHGARFIAIEVKDPNGSTDPERLSKQVAFLERLRHCGGIGILAKSMDDVIRGLREGL